MTSGFWLLMYLNQTFCEENLYFLDRSTWSFSRQHSFPEVPLHWLAVVACSATYPGIHQLKRLILVAKETIAFLQVGVAYSEVVAFCFLHFFSNSSWQYTILLQNVVNPVSSASMWHKQSFYTWFLEYSAVLLKGKMVNKCILAYALVLLQRCLPLQGLFALQSFRPAAEAVALDLLPFWQIHSSTRCAFSGQCYHCHKHLVVHGRDSLQVVMQKQHRDGEIRYSIFPGKQNPTLDRKRKCFPCAFQSQMGGDLFRYCLYIR